MKKGRGASHASALSSLPSSVMVTITFHTVHGTGMDAAGGLDIPEHGFLVLQKTGYNIISFSTFLKKKQQKTFKSY